MKGCAVGERDVNADGAEEARYRSGAAVMPEGDGNAATLPLLNSYIADVGKRPGTAMPVPAAE